MTESRTALRERIEDAIRDSAFPGLTVQGATDAVLAVRDDEVAALKLELSMAHTATDSYSRSAERSAQSAAEHRRRADQAEAALAGAKALHSRDDSNPLGPWCGTCTTSWPCDTWTALDVPADGEQTPTDPTEEGNSMCSGCSCCTEGRCGGEDSQCPTSQHGESVCPCTGG